MQFTAHGYITRLAAEALYNRAVVASYADELGIMKHAQRLADIAGCARATTALHSALLNMERKAADGAVKLALSQAIARPNGSH